MGQNQVVVAITLYDIVIVEVPTVSWLLFKLLGNNKLKPLFWWFIDR